MNNSTSLFQWVIYDHPKDYPDCFVARCWIVANEPEATAEVMWSTSLERLRDEMMKRGLFCIPRMDGDDPTIVEVWM